MAEAHPNQESSHYGIHSLLLCVLMQSCKRSHQLASALYFVFMYILFDFPADVVSKGHPLGVQRGKTGTQVPHGVQRAKRKQVTCRSGAEARAVRPSLRPLFSDVLHLAQLSIDTHRSARDETKRSAAKPSLTATQRLPDSSLILLRGLLLFLAILSWIATTITAEHLSSAKSFT